MNLGSRASLTGLFALCFALTAARSQSRHDEAAAAMASAAKIFLAELDPDQRSRASLAFDSPARTDWHFVPRERKGLAIGELDMEDRAHFDGLLDSALSTQGHAKFDGVLKLEAILCEREGASRDPAKYHIAIFGTPGVDPWSWRIEGHHWTMHFTSVDAEVIAVTPSFLGANPSRVTQGSDSGFELLGGEDAKARAFVKSLSAEQLARARLEGATPGDVLLSPSKSRFDKPAQGICAKDLDTNQRELLFAIVDNYLADLSPSLAIRERARFGKHPPEHLFFALSGDAQTGNPWYWRLEGKYFAIEFVHLNGDASHAHRIWRDFERDLGGDALREHLAREK